MGKSERNSSTNLLDIDLIHTFAFRDIRTSLGVLCNKVELNKALYDDYASFLYEFSRVQHNVTLTENLVKMSSSSLALNIDKTFVLDFLEMIMAITESFAAAKKISTQIDCEEDLEWAFDSTLVGSVITNEINNTIRYANNPIIVSAKQENGFLVIRVECEGVRYPNEMLIGPQDNIEGIELAGITSLNHYYAMKVAQLHQCNNKQGKITILNDSQTQEARSSIFLP